jgi:hypothetical protein
VRHGLWSKFYREGGWYNGIMIVVCASGGRMAEYTGPTQTGHTLRGREVAHHTRLITP